MNDDLKTYRDRRDFRKTAEPAAKTAARENGRRYCLQKHAATTTHFDLRLEHDGVLKSWAVTKGPSLDPSVKRLAVATEDHPVDYAGFEGTIPEDEYGGGTVMLFDAGEWEPLKDDVDAALKDGELTFELHGERLTGRWALVRMDGRGDGDRENWLLIKQRDRHAGKRDVAEKWKTSVETGRTMKQIANADRDGGT
jgi:bifunctional non-homologous end joining protein LigD